MIYKLVNRLLPARGPSQATDCHLKEDFATWRAAALAKDTTRRPVDHESSVGCECIQRLCGPGVCDLANDALTRR
jgi:hypothetical protein